MSNRRLRCAKVVVAVALVASGCASGDDGEAAATSTTTAAPTTTEARDPSAPPWTERLTGYIEAEDGTELRYSVLLPAGKGPFPVIVNYSGYDPGSIGGSAYLAGKTAMSPDLDSQLLEAGYAVLGVNMRGTGCSDGGAFDLFSPKWGTDGRDAVEWAGTQDWSDGNIGMVNWSYAGIGQLFAAVEQPEHLKAIVPGMVVTDPYRDVGAPGGVPNTVFPLGWWAFIQEQWGNARATAEAEGDRTCLDRIAEHLALSENTSPPAMQVQHPFDDEWGRSRVLRTRTQLINVPVLSFESWQDGATSVRGGYYQETIDPDLLWYVGANGGHDLYESETWRNYLLRFLDHFVKGVDNGFEDEPRVQLWQDSTGPGAPLPAYSQLTEAEPGWVITDDEFPVEVDPITFWLGPDGALADTAPKATAAPSTYSFPDPGPSVNTILEEGGGTWSTKPPSMAGSVAFTTAELDDDMTFYGSASADLWVASTAADTDLQVTVTEVRPDGEELFVQRGWLRLSRRALDEDLSSELRPVLRLTEGSVEPLTPGVAVLGRVEIQKFSYVFRKGSRIRIWVDTPSLTGEQGFAVLETPSTNRILQDAEHPSKVVFGVVENAPDPQPASECGRILSQPCRPDPLAAG
ncbi:MAG: CocE/NonD family hydrolase [Microthrixaceae bacterium]|nr:CocE/NonD family hydrolase [Microthrixaceae bacterium]